MEVTLILNGWPDNIDESQNEVPQLITVSDDEISIEVIDKFSDDKGKTKPVSTTRSIVFLKKSPKKLKSEQQIKRR